MFYLEGFGFGGPQRARAARRPRSFRCAAVSRCELTLPPLLAARRRNSRTSSLVLSAITLY